MTIFGAIIGLGLFIALVIQQEKLESIKKVLDAKEEQIKGLQRYNAALTQELMKTKRRLHEK